MTFLKYRSMIKYYLNLNTFRRAKPPNPFVYEGLRGF